METTIVVNEVLSPQKLVALLTPGQTIAGLDLGTKTIGLAVSDRDLTLASPRPVIRRTKFAADMAQLLATLQTENCGGVVLGMPYNMDGSAGPRVQATKAFARNFSQQSDLPLLFWDERLSTVAAERALLERDMSRKKRAERIDSAAASFILQGVLDALNPR